MLPAMFPSPVEGFQDRLAELGWFVYLKRTRKTRGWCLTAARGKHRIVARSPDSVEALRLAWEMAERLEGERGN
jgi:hypothetical protein